MTRFSAALDAWVPVTSQAGRQSVSLRDALIRAHEFIGLDTGDPLADVALTRLLVAFAMRTHDLADLEQLAELLAAGRFNAQLVDAYVERHADRFEVFHPSHPFLQVAALEPTSGKGASSTNALRLDAPSGNNVPLFARALDPSAPSMSVPEALVRLIALQAFDVAGIKPGMVGDPEVTSGKTMGNRTGLCGGLGTVLLVGRNLFETLALNTPTGMSDDHDTPCWERDIDVTWEVRSAAGPLDLLTWQSRRVRLIPDADSDRVIGALVGAGDRLSVLPPALEPHTRWRTVKGDDVPQRPVRWQPGRSAWRGLDSLIALQETPEGMTAPHTIRQLVELEDQLGVDYPLRAFCVGVEYGSQSAVIESVMVDQLPLPLAALRVDDRDDVAVALAEVCHAAEGLRRALNELDTNVRRASGGDKIEWDKGRHPGDDAMGLLTLPTHRLLQHLQEHPGDAIPALAIWRTEARRLVMQSADTILNGANPRSFDGHKVTLADAEAWFRKKVFELIPIASTDPTINDHRREA